MIQLVEHFYSIQGEGRYIGRPSLFFRFGGCNMQCVGFGCSEVAPNSEIYKGCDTIYAVHKAFKQNWVEIRSSDELIAILKSYEIDFSADVVFTGGEPLLYANNSIFIEFLEYLRKHNHRVTFETNATIAPDFVRYPIFKEATYALSVKLANSGEAYNKRVCKDVITLIATEAKEAFFKFSIDEASIDASLDSEIEDITSCAEFLEIYCMPVGGSKEEIEKNTPALIEYCKQKGYIFSDRLHIRVWDSNKGV